MEREHPEDELDPVKDLFNALGEKEDSLGEAHRRNPALDWDPNAGYGLSSGRPQPRLPEDQPFVGEQPGLPLKRVGQRSLFSRLISKLFASRS